MLIHLFIKPFIRVQNWSKYLDFADWWNFDNLHLDDYLKEEFNGKIAILVHAGSSSHLVQN